MLAADMKAHSGTITLADLESYKAIERKPLTGKYRGYDIITAPPPSSGGVGILQMLGVLEGTGYEKGGAGSAEVVHYMTEAMRRFFADRNQWMGDPDFVKVPVKGMLDPEYIKKLRASIDPVRATPSAEVKAGSFTRPESFETTHFTVADEEGNIVSRDVHLERRIRQQGDRRRAWASCSITKWTISPRSPARPTCSAWCRAKPIRLRRTRRRFRP